MLHLTTLQALAPVHWSSVHVHEYTARLLRLAGRRSYTRHLTGGPANELQGLPRSSETLRFAEELLARTPRAGAAPNDYRERERQAAAVVRLHGPKHSYAIYQAAVGPCLRAGSGPEALSAHGMPAALWSGC